LSILIPQRPKSELEEIYEREAQVALQRQDSTGRLIGSRGSYSPRIAYGTFHTNHSECHVSFQSFHFISFIFFFGFCFVFCGEGSDSEELIRRLVLQKRVDLNQPVRVGGHFTQTNKQTYKQTNFHFSLFLWSP
jgi:hypothetical protein